MARVNVYIDGFNFYYPLLNKIRDPNSQWRYEHQWCNFRTLFEQYLAPGEKLHRVYYFSSYRKGNTVKKEEDQNYVLALYHFGIQTVLGNYQSKTFSYKKGKNPLKSLTYLGEEDCKEYLERLAYRGYEEKETDVKVAVQIVEDAFNNTFDRAIIVSGDSDIIPAIQSVRRNVERKNIPKKTFTSILIPGTKGYKIRKACDDTYEITGKQMEVSIMPHDIKLKNGKMVHIPKTWLEG